MNLTEFVIDGYNKGLSPRAISKEIFEKFGIVKTRNAVIGLKYRYAHMDGKGKPIEKRKYVKRPPVLHPPPRPSPRPPAIEFIQHYKKKWECQYIGDNMKKCEIESQGPWCEEHKKIVFKPR